MTRGKPNPASELRKAKNAKWEDLLAYHLAQYGLSRLFQREYIIPELGRKWRWDFADPTNRVAIEFQGAIWVPNRGHSHGTGIQRDHAKLNAAQYHRWTVFHFDDKAVRTLAAIDLIRDFYARYIFNPPGAPHGQSTQAHHQNTTPTTSGTSDGQG